jgi:hypothetical protein
MKSVASAALMVAALANAVPSTSALHPAIARLGLKEADLTGAGRESSSSHTRMAGSLREAPDRSSKEWREMAARCRSLAEWNPEGRAILIGLAEEYEERAARAEDGKREAKE